MKLTMLSSVAGVTQLECAGEVTQNDLWNDANPLEEILGDQGFTRKVLINLANAILPVVTVVGIEFAFLIGGLVVTETVFNLPGVARFLVQAILWRDYPVVQAAVFTLAATFVLVNLVVDVLYTYLDPRIRLR